MKTKVNIIAKCCHEANRAYCASLGDHSQPAWNDAPQWQIDSAMAGVLFHLENPKSKPCDSHNSWMKQKIDDGWVYGEVKDPDSKNPPMHCAFEHLPKEQQAKDYIFTAIVHALSSEA